MAPGHYRAPVSDTTSHGIALVIPVPKSESRTFRILRRPQVKASLGPRVGAHLPFANLGTRRVVRPSSRCGDRRRVLLWHERPYDAGADGTGTRRLPIV